MNRTKPHSKGDPEFLLKLQSRDVEAFRELYEKYSDALFGVLCRILKDDSLAEDTLQEAFLKCWKKIHTYDQGKGTIFTWMLNIARNTAIDLLRSKEMKHKSRFSGIDNLSQGKHAPNTETPIIQIGLDDFVAKLPPEQRQVIDYVYFNGYSHSEASKALGLPLGTIKTRIRIALRDLRSQMT